MCAWNRNFEAYVAVLSAHSETRTIFYKITPNLARKPNANTCSFHQHAGTFDKLYRREEADQLCGEVRSLTVTLENIREERAKLVDINTDLTNQVNTVI